MSNESPENLPETENGETNPNLLERAVVPFQRIANPNVVRMAAYVTLVLAGTWWLLDQLGVILRPLLFAIFLSYVLLPISRTLRSFLPHVVAVAVVMIITTMPALLLGGMVFNNIREMQKSGKDLEEAFERIDRFYHAVQDKLEGVFPRLPKFEFEPVDLEKQNGNRTENGNGKEDEDNGDGDKEQNDEEDKKNLIEVVPSQSGPIRNSISENQWLLDQSTDYFMYAFNLLVSWGTEIVIGFTYLFFILMGSAKVSERVRSAFSEPKAEHILSEAARINDAIVGYLKGKFWASLLLAAPIGVVLASFGVRFAATWAVLTFFGNFIPYLGSMVALTLPTLFAFVQLDATWNFVAVAALLAGWHALTASVFEPMILGKYVGLSPLVILGALSFWGTLWGIPGLFLAIPMTVIVLLILENFEVTQPIARLLNDRSR